MATKNNRIFQPQAQTINGIAAGGLTRHNIQIGYDDVLQNPVDGLALQMADLVTEFVRGSFASQDWVHVIELLTGSVGTDVFYQRKSGTAEADGYIKHTLTNPVVYQVSLSLRHRGYAAAIASFECRAADEDDGMADLWSIANSQSAPTYVSAARGLEITAGVHGGNLNIYHVTGLDLNIALPLSKASQDGDVGYTAVDAITNGMTASGSLIIQDAEITSSKPKMMDMIEASRGDLVLTVKQSQGAADKTLTIAGVKFGAGAGDHNAAGNDYDEFSVPFICTNDVDTQLTLSGANKLVAIT